MVVGFVGLGLIGGSMAQAARAYTSNIILGMDKNKVIENEALESGVLFGIIDEKNLSECDLLILGLYPREAIEFMELNAKYIKKGSCVVDLGGVKRMVCDSILPISIEAGFYFIGGHPMAGCEKSGYTAATPGLFRGASMILVPSAKVPDALLTQIEIFFRSLQFEHIVFTDKDTHDKIISYTSQLVHILSNAYMKSPADLRYKGFSAGSFRDFTRVATINADMWTQLFMDNRDFLVCEIDEFCTRLAAYREALQSGDETLLQKLLREGNDWKAEIMDKNKQIEETFSSRFLKETPYAKYRGKNRQTV